jgi:hypothetical protein
MEMTPKGLREGRFHGGRSSPATPGPAEAARDSIGEFGRGERLTEAAC